MLDSSGVNRLRSVVWLAPALLVFAASSCELEPEYIPNATPERPSESKTITTRFDAATCGRVAGRVTWRGERPAPPPFLYGAPAADGNFTLQFIPNPNAPIIDERTRGAAGAVVFLRGIDPAAAKPWDLPPVSVELKDRGIHIRQGESMGRTGFVRRGEAVEMRSAEPLFHILRARGAAFFSLAFPKPEQPLSRTFDTAGRVELSSGAGFYWASADLFVMDHPYCTRTDAEGRFAFERVPSGSFEVAVWLPGWDVVKQERDPETGLIARQTYGKPVEASRTAKLADRGSVEINIELP